ncbi:MAG: hypothetical protein KDJ16_09775 [Hyphomicrobiales bacterium]|nr:hypothetical protein [Hyphomicrobiales bacterium]
MDFASGALGAAGGRLAGVGAAVGALGVAAYEMEEIIRLVKFVGEFIHDPKAAMGRLFGGDEAKAAVAAPSVAAAGVNSQAKAMLAALPAGGGTKASVPSFEETSVAVHEPGRARSHGPVAAVRMGPNGGPRTVEEAYLLAAETAQRNGRPIKAGSIVEMELMRDGKKSHVNVEAVDGQRFLPIAGENGHSKLVLPRGFEEEKFAAEAAKRVEGTKGLALDARLGVPGGPDGFVTAGPALMATGRAEGKSAEAVRLAGLGLGIGGIGATKEVDGRRAGAPDGSVAVFASKGTSEGGRALRYDGALIDGGKASLVVSTSGAGSDQSTIMSAKTERPGLSRIAVVTGSAKGLGGVGADGKMELSEAGRQSIHTIGEAAGRRMDVLLAGTEKLGAKRESAVVVDRDSGRAVESVWSGNRMVTVSDGRIDLVTKGADGKLNVRSLEDREAGVDRDTGISRMSPASLSAVSEFSRGVSRPGMALDARDFMQNLPVRAARRDGAGIGD